MPDSSYFEVRCERCQTSFAAGTKQCVHCGGAIGRRLIALDTLAGRDSSVPPRGEPGEPSAQAAQPAIGRVLRIAMIALVALTAIVRACIERS
jgi:hypothetical protein